MRFGSGTVRILKIGSDVKRRFCLDLFPPHFSKKSKEAASSAETNRETKAAGTFKSESNRTSRKVLVHPIRGLQQYRDGDISQNDHAKKRDRNEPLFLVDRRQSERG